MLVTNGCSFVWGDELEGYDTSPPSHWHLTFTHILAEKLGCDYHNLGTCGASNHKIFRDTMRYLQRTEQKPEHLVILWSAWQREEHAEAMSEKREKQLKIQRWSNLTQVSPDRVHNINESDREIIRNYFEIKNVRQCITTSLTYMNTIQHVCDLMDIRLLQGVFHERMKNNLMQTLHPRWRKLRWGDWMDHTLDQLDGLRESSKIGLNDKADLYSFAKFNYKIQPYGHPNEDAHAAYAELLYDWFIEYYGKK